MWWQLSETGVYQSFQTQSNHIVDKQKNTGKRLTLVQLIRVYDRIAENTQSSSLMKKLTRLQCCWQNECVYYVFLSNGKFRQNKTCTALNRSNYHFFYLRGRGSTKVPRGRKGANPFFKRRNKNFRLKNNTFLRTQWSRFYSFSLRRIRKMIIKNFGKCNPSKIQTHTLFRLAQGIEDKID